MKYKLELEGMSCEHCVKHVTNALNELSGVISVRVDLKQKSAEVDTESEITEAMFKEVLDDAGYDLVGLSK